MTAASRLRVAKLSAFAGVVIGAGGALGDAAAQSADAARAFPQFPSRPIRVIVPFPPGGSNDILGRFMAQKMTERLGQQAIVDNRGGADGIIGTEIAARSPPDGHTLLIVSTTYTMNPAIHKLPYDPVKSLIPISLIGAGANVIAVTPSLPVKTLKELIALAKSRPGQLHYASSGVGGFNHFGGELFKSMAGVKILHVPYKGGGPAMIDVMTGQVEILFGTPDPDAAARALGEAEAARRRLGETLAGRSRRADDLRRRRSRLRRQHLVGNPRSRGDSRADRHQAQYRDRRDPARPRDGEAPRRRSRRAGRRNARSVRQAHR